MENVLRLSEILEEKGMSVTELSEKSGLSYNYCSELSRNVKFPSKKNLIVIAQSLEVDIPHLFRSFQEPDHEVLYVKRNNEFEPIGRLLKH